MHNAYQQALQQIDELIAHLRSHSSSSCSLAEQEDAVLVKLNALKHSLRPDNTQAFTNIQRYHHRTFHHDRND